MYIRPLLLDKLQQLQQPQKVIIIYGPRRVGKTTLLHNYLESKENYLLVSGEDIDVQHYLSSQSLEKLKSFVGKANLLVVDEAQKIPKIALNFKLLVDHMPNLQIVATGSSAFDLAQQVGEPLTGRKYTLQMFPLSQMEINSIETAAQTRAQLEQRLIYGAYPEVILMADNRDKREYLTELTMSYLYKDILEIEGVRKSSQLTHLLQLLALQIGKEVSLTEIGQQIGLNKGTVERYLDLLEKAFVLISVSGYSRNLRKEISKRARYYFYDLGVRNALIKQFNPLALRNDAGELWENYIVIERLKKQAYQQIYANNYFWRTYDQHEIDWVEERDGELFGYEIKWKAQREKPPKAWREAYPSAHFGVIQQDNYLDFIT